MTDLLISVPAIILLMPLFLLLGIAVAADSRGGIVYRQQRVGRHRKPFSIYKFRSMHPAQGETSLSLTVGDTDRRITRCGHWMRKYKLDELPQLFNVLKGEMSLVGPRPEVPEYVNLYTPEQLRVLSIKPGITDEASLVYLDENNMLAGVQDPEVFYINHIMPHKLACNLKYVENRSLWTDLRIIIKTLRQIVRKDRHVLSAA